jgi:hypothetical protein
MLFYSVLMNGKKPSKLSNLLKIGTTLVYQKKKGKVILFSLISRCHVTLKTNTTTTKVNK